MAGLASVVLPLAKHCPGSKLSLAKPQPNWTARELLLKSVTAASAGSQAVSAITAHRTIPAPAESIAAPAGPMRSSKGRPGKRTTVFSMEMLKDFSVTYRPNRGLEAACREQKPAVISCRQAARITGLVARHELHRRDQ